MTTESRRRKPTTDDIASGRPTEAPAPQRRGWADWDEDVQLMLAFQDGDESAFATLIERNQARVHAVVYRFLSGNGDVEDIVQEVFVRVFRSAQRYRATARFSTWLYRITANLCLNALRKRSKNKTLRFVPASEADEAFTGADVPDEKAPAPEAALREAELAERIRQAIERLPDKQRMAMVLLRYEHMDYQQIAEVLGCTTMAVKSLLSRARATLRDALADDLRP
ncbi:MAG: RNA polymerase sigma factor [Planctomycetota bacterium]